MSDNEEKKDEEKKPEYEIIAKINAKDVNIVDAAKSLSESTAAMKVYLEDSMALKNLVEAAAGVSLKMKGWENTFSTLDSVINAKFGGMADLSQSLDSILDQFQESLNGVGQALSKAVLPDYMSGLYNGLGLAENRIDEIIPQVKVIEPASENQDVLDKLQELNAEIKTLRGELKELKDSLEQVNDKMLIAERGHSLQELPTEKISKKGPYKYSDEKKLKAIKDWNQLDKSKYPINLDEWLIERFGEDGGVPNVAKSTFYGWKKPLKDKGLMV